MMIVVQQYEDSSSLSLCRRWIMKGIDERGKAPIVAYDTDEVDSADDSPTRPAIDLEGAGPSHSAVEQTRSDPHGSNAGALPVEGRGPHLTLDVLGVIAEQLSPIDLLMTSRAGRQLRDAAQLSPELHETRQRAIRVQSVWDRVTTPRPGIADRFGALINSGAIRTLAPNVNCLTRGQQEHLVALAEGLNDPEQRVSVIEDLGAR
ncbi:hypothetical protein [Bradyrhizobium sp. 164]|uniref:hypothetical protein n=2 Tax=unclassified Bradyrhizobium TaxID=2631580 RepID=UPI001FFBB185|nr:hypothetical protein [Bradyrhizobium sp. 164]MCK1593443.1 hypothetical protein [Bradyrhizobium sp. 164]